MQRFAAAGAQVVIADVNADLGAALAAADASVRFIRTDVTDEASVQSAVDLAVREFGGLSGAINCAGIGVAERTVGRHGPHALDLFVRS